MIKRLLESSRRPDIVFNRNGKIRITARVARSLSLHPGDTINIAVINGEYLLHGIRVNQNRGRHEAQCYRTKKGSENYCANSVRLSRTFLDLVGATSNKVSYMVGEIFEYNGVTYAPIITLHPLL